MQWYQCCNDTSTVECCMNGVYDRTPAAQFSPESSEGAVEGQSKQYWKSWLCSHLVSSESAVTNLSHRHNEEVLWAVLVDTFTCGILFSPCPGLYVPALLPWILCNIMQLR